MYANGKTVDSCTVFTSSSCISPTLVVNAHLSITSVSSTGTPSSCRNSRNLMRSWICWLVFMLAEVKGFFGFGRISEFRFGIVFIVSIHFSTLNLKYSHIFFFSGVAVKYDVIADLPLRFLRFRSFFDFFDKTLVYQFFIPYRYSET